MIEKTVSYTSTARYYEHGNKSTAKELWFVLHGHGQLAKYFIRKFAELDPNHFLVIAPEGLSRYYLEGYTGKVGATWMTKEDRITDIENYVNYLNTVYHQVIKEVGDHLKVTVLGFSQGTATASRWIAQSTIRVNRLLLWAGIFPPDMDIQSAHDRFAEIEVLNIYGDKDEFLDTEHLNEQKTIVQKLGIQATSIEFIGNHAIDPSTLLSVANTPTDS